MTTTPARPAPGTGARSATGPLVGTAAAEARAHLVEVLDARQPEPVAPRSGVHRRRPARARPGAAVAAAVDLRRHRRGGPRGRRLRHRRARHRLGAGAARRRRGGARLPQRLPPPRRPARRGAEGLGRQHRVRLPPLDLRHRRPPHPRPPARAGRGRRSRPGLPVAAHRPPARGGRAAVRLPRPRAARRPRRGGRPPSRRTSPRTRSTAPRSPPRSTSSRPATGS